MQEGDVVVSCKAVVKVGDSSDVPRVACHGARKEGAGVMDKVGDD